MEGINSCIRGVYDCLPSKGQITSNMRKITEVASKPLALLIGLDLVSGAEAGAIAYGICVGSCCIVTFFQNVPGCHEACSTLL